MKKIIEAIKAFFSPEAPIVEVKKEVVYKIEPTVVEEEAPKPAPKKKAKKKPAKKTYNYSRR
jgi:hypothetical protein